MFKQRWKLTSLKCDIKRDWQFEIISSFCAVFLLTHSLHLSSHIPFLQMKLRQRKSIVYFQIYLDQVVFLDLSRVYVFCDIEATPAVVLFVDLDRGEHQGSTRFKLTEMHMVPY